MKLKPRTLLIMISLTLFFLLLFSQFAEASQDNGLIGWIDEKNKEKQKEQEEQRDELSDEDRERNLWLEIDAQLQGLDVREFDALMDETPEEVRDLWGDRSVSDLIYDMMGGGELVSLENLQGNIFSLLKQALSGQMHMILALISLAIIAAILEQVKSAFSAGASDIAGFVCYSMAMIIAVVAFARVVNDVRVSLDRMSGLMEAIFPPLLVLLASSGAAIAAGLFQPATSLLTITISSLNENFFLPMFLSMGVLAIIGNISDNVSLGRVRKLLQSVSKWSIGAMSTIYLGIITLRGISAKTQDGLSLRAARFALEKFVPYVGSLLSGSSDAAIGAAMVLKNGVGICAMLLIAGTLTVPLMQIFALQISFRLASAAVEALGDSRLAKGLDGLANALSYLFAIAAVQALMFIITVALIMGAGLH